MVRVSHFASAVMLVLTVTTANCLSISTKSSAIPASSEQSTQKKMTIEEFVADLLVEESKKASYRYGYNVVPGNKDESQFSHAQKVEDGTTRGQYRILLPDNRWQIVSYVADDSGYRASVQYEPVSDYEGTTEKASLWGYNKDKGKIPSETDSSSAVRPKYPQEEVTNPREFYRPSSPNPEYHRQETSTRHYNEPNKRPSSEPSFSSPRPEYPREETSTRHYYREHERHETPTPKHYHLQHEKPSVVDKSYSQPIEKVTSNGWKPLLRPSTAPLELGISHGNRHVQHPPLVNKHPNPATRQPHLISTEYDTIYFSPPTTARYPPVENQDGGRLPPKYLQTLYPNPAHERTPYYQPVPSHLSEPPIRKKPHTGYPEGIPLSGVIVYRPQLQQEEAIRNQHVRPDDDFDSTLEGIAPTEPPEIKPHPPSHHVRKPDNFQHQRPPQYDEEKRHKVAYNPESPPEDHSTHWKKPSGDIRRPVNTESHYRSIEYSSESPKNTRKPVNDRPAFNSHAAPPSEIHVRDENPIQVIQRPPFITKPREEERDETPIRIRKPIHRPVTQKYEESKPRKPVADVENTQRPSISFVDPPEAKKKPSESIQLRPKKTKNPTNTDLPSVLLQTYRYITPEEASSENKKRPIVPEVDEKTNHRKYKNTPIDNFGTRTHPLRRPESDGYDHSEDGFFNLPSVDEDPRHFNNPDDIAIDSDLEGFPLIEDEELPVNVEDEAVIFSQGAPRMKKKENTNQDDSNKSSLTELIAKVLSSTTTPAPLVATTTDVSYSSSKSAAGETTKPRRKRPKGKRRKIKGSNPISPSKGNAELSSTGKSTRNRSSPPRIHIEEQNDRFARRDDGEDLEEEIETAESSLVESIGSEEDYDYVLD